MHRVAVDAPAVQKQRGKWVVRHVGYDPATGRRKVRQLGTFATKKAALERSRAVGAGLVATADDEEGEKARLGVTSTRLVRKILSMAMEDAVQRGRLPRNPVSLTRPPRAVRSSTSGLSSRGCGGASCSGCGGAMSVSTAVFSSCISSWPP